ncbi:MAG: cysteine--tRNA ligase, partial [Thermoplasmata archaeon]|nr:cysteine--tRNA ligase [Thermoplasmata archaeon]
MRRFSVYDTMSRSVRLFQPRHPPRVGLFVCGLTPYADSHIGHGRTFVTFDMVARSIRHWGYRLFHVQNVTNLDDKLIERGGAEGVDPLLLAERHFASYHRSMTELGVNSVDLYPFATDYIPEILVQIQQLVDKGVAYVVDGSLYYDIAHVPAYGRHSGQQLSELRAGSRLDVDPKHRAPEDFAIWKAATPG